MSDLAGPLRAGKADLFTGATGTIRCAAAHRLAEAGALVMLAGRTGLETSGR